MADICMLYKKTLQKFRSSMILCIIMTILCLTDVQPGFILTNNKELHVGSSNNLVIAVGTLATLFSLATVALVIIGVQVWKRRHRYSVTRNARSQNDDLDWSLFSSQASNMQYDQIQSGFNSPIFTGNDRLSNQTVSSFYFE